MRGVFFFVFVIVLLIVSPDFSDFSGRVVGVSDGDTIKVLHDGKAERIRLNGIDSPEKAHPFGTRAKHFTSAMVFGNKVTVQTHRPISGVRVSPLITAAGHRRPPQMVAGQQG